MDGLTTEIPAGALVGIDTVAFIYHLEHAPRYVPVVAPFFQALAQGSFFAISSVISLMEIAVRPLQLDRAEIADDYEVLLLSHPNLTIVDVDRHVARRAADIRARYRLRPADSLQVATAIGGGATHFVTNDRDFSRVPDINVLLIDQFVSSV